ncbi:alpha/beta fold hydrolase [Limnohabitans sp. Hippo4]|uniref:alpha/beta fold hydrolase n=1 Tax=Limnohabitans sp. Hippo4 TaxID=1826167 RepID=UPI000D3AE12B|nr:alpha/beta fold hydrolase [Limnohabitans sp. Hippo4]PUE36784.1 hypothetical protein B9Z46_08925 [Limnohabitans sp. Hippo4]
MKPVFLLVPGMLNDSRVWHEVAIGMQDNVQVRIAQVQTQATIADMARDAWTMLDDVSPDVPIYLAGFSMGGYVAMNMLAHPKRALHGLALLDTAGGIETDESRVQREKTIRAMEIDFDKTLHGLMKWNCHEPGEELLDRMRQMMQDVGFEVAVRQMRAISARQGHRSVLEQLRIPVQILCGENDRVTPPARSQELAQWIPGARLQLVPGAGHMLPMEQPQAVLKALLALMDF